MWYQTVELVFRVFYSPKVDKIIIWREREREKERKREIEREERDSYQSIFEYKLRFLTP